MDQNPYQPSENPLYMPDVTPSATADRLKLEGEMRNSVGWFYWIAGTTVVNTIVILFEGNFSFLLGVSLPQFASGIALGLREEFGQQTFLIAAVVAVAVTLLVAGFFAGIGYFAGQRHTWAFILGTVLYAIDTVIFLLLGEFMSVALHGLALVFLFQGILTCRKINHIDAGGTVASPYGPM